MSNSKTHLTNAEMYAQQELARRAALKKSIDTKEDVYIAPRTNGYWIRGLNKQPLWLDVNKRY